MSFWKVNLQEADKASCRFTPRLSSPPKTLLKMKETGLAEAEAFEESLKESSEEPGCVNAERNILASGLFPTEDTGQFLAADTRDIIREAAKKSCFICDKMGASITCCQTGCDRAFHLPCAPDGQCVTQYFGTYRSFCWEHSPQQALQPRPSQDNICTICLDAMEDKISYKTMGCPACQDARFHRQCIQRLALHAGIGFRCPRCLNQEPFMIEMLTMGIRLSKRPWQLWLCSSCAAEGTHRHCSSLGKSTNSWECNTCAGTDTGSNGKPELVSPRTSTQAVATLSQDTFHRNRSCSLHPRQAMKRHYPEEETQPETTYSPPAKCCRIKDGPAHSAETTKPSASSQAASQLPQGKCPIKTSSCSSCPRQAFKRGYPEEENYSGVSYGPPKKRCRIDNGPAQSADESGPSTSRQVVSGLAGVTPATNSQAARPQHPYRPPWIFHGFTRDNRSQPGPIRMRHVWRQQQRAKKPYSRPGNNSRTNCQPAHSR
ncbi:hypothetical protein DUI87_11401 [Hirundo rustica rustica]|uniref:PHD-type domain-containing protein n=1 Tax=Hirundo rustica rustica TaxID=333673 RepID=A0A3M0KDS5_HIRRU|nr:hypothetical protein DUI87_11401 [Hirundo rustica rustica]